MDYTIGTDHSVWYGTRFVGANSNDSEALAMAFTDMGKRGKQAEVYYAPSGPGIGAKIAVKVEEVIVL